MRALLSLAVCALAVLGAAAPAQAADTVELIVGREPGLSAAERAALRADAGVEFERSLRLDHAEIVTVPAGRAAAALAALRADPDVRWAQRDGLVHAQAGTADPLFPYLWGLENSGRTIQGQAGLRDADMDVPAAWRTATGAGVTVAVVDTGVDASHPDLAGRLALNPGETGGGRETNGLDDDRNGLADDWRGYDFAYGDNDPDDVDGHGSHVAGTIAAANGNAAGVSGVAPDARILALKALDDTGTGTWSTIASAFDHAADTGARIVNASLGAPDYAPAIDAAISRHPNTLFVVAAGNDGLDLGGEIYYPCEAAQPNVVCVGASDNRDARAGFSNYGPSAVDVFAPGVSVLSTRLGDYWWLDGTSMAAPHVAGTAALLLSADSTLTAAELKAAILDSADRKEALAPYGRDGGRTNAAAALAAIAGSGDGDTGAGEAPVQQPLAAPAEP
ncbi:MAG TPA: S8 family peptidase, partial [Solirubrobacteraceae bacterium]|nr:S8 family peptidase [Solirubrobacteraceae bacterium]